MDRHLLKGAVLGSAVVMSLGLIACGDDDDDATSPTAAPTPTATPVPPMNDDFRVISMEIAKEGEGVDIDGTDGPDNGIYEAIDSLMATTLTAIEDALLAAELEQDVIDNVLTIAEEALTTVLDVQSFSDALNTPIQTFQVNYVLNFAGQADGSVDLNWYSGDMTASGGIEVDTSGETAVLGSQSGTLADDGTGVFEGNIGLSFVFEPPDLPTPPTAKAQPAETFVLTLYAGKTEVENYNIDTLRNGMFGGAILIDDLVRVVEDILTSLSDVLPEDFDVQGTIETAQTNLENIADVDLDEGLGFSISLEIAADGTSVDYLTD